MVKIHFLAQVVGPKGPSWELLVSENIHKFPEERTTIRLVQSDTELPVGSFIYVYNAELDQITRVVAIREFTEIAKPGKDSYKQEATAIDPAVVKDIEDQDKFPCHISPMYT